MYVFMSNKEEMVIKWSVGEGEADPIAIYQLGEASVYYIYIFIFIFTEQQGVVCVCHSITIRLTHELALAWLHQIMEYWLAGNKRKKSD